MNWFRIAQWELVLNGVSTNSALSVMSVHAPWYCWIGFIMVSCHDMKVKDSGQGQCSASLYSVNVSMVLMIDDTRVDYAKIILSVAELKITVSSFPRTVNIYLHENGVGNDFLKVELPDLPAEKTTFNVTMLSKQITCTMVFGMIGVQGTTPMEIMVVYDARLHYDLPRLIKCPYLILARSVENIKYIDLTIEHLNDIGNIIDVLLTEEAERSEHRVNREVIAFYVTASIWSGICPMVIVETVSSNFQLVHVHNYFGDVANIASCVVDVSQTKSGNHAYRVMDIKENHIMDVADAIGIYVVERSLFGSAGLSQVINVFVKDDSLI
ncbi:hypothetical protein HD554DRAFT_2036463 [Boletus coccyginus]|nr:hypothetical protein HD554DRAFT_2036463 [Boletus coccyginus]